MHKMNNFDYDLRAVQEARDLARSGKIASEQIARYTDEQIDRILCKMVQVAEENEMLLAQMAVEETGFGKVADKAYKNHMASRMLYDAIKDMKTSGIVREDPQNRLIEIAEPDGAAVFAVPLPVCAPLLSRRYPTASPPISPIVSAVFRLTESTNVPTAYPKTIPTMQQIIKIRFAAMTSIILRFLNRFNRRS